MNQNPIEQLVAGYFRRGQRVRELLPDQLHEPTAVVVVLENGKEYSHAVDADDRGGLPEWLTQAKMFLQLKRATL